MSVQNQDIAKEGKIKLMNLEEMGEIIIIKNEGYGLISYLNGQITSVHFLEMIRNSNKDRVIVGKITYKNIKISSIYYIPKKNEVEKMRLLGEVVKNKRKLNSELENKVKKIIDFEIIEPKGLKELKHLAMRKIIGEEKRDYKIDCGDEEKKGVGIFKIKGEKLVSEGSEIINDMIEMRYEINREDKEKMEIYKEIIKEFYQEVKEINIHNMKKIKWKCRLDKSTLFTLFGKKNIVITEVNKNDVIFDKLVNARLGAGEEIRAEQRREDSFVSIKGVLSLKVDGIEKIEEMQKKIDNGETYHIDDNSNLYIYLDGKWGLKIEWRERPKEIKEVIKIEILKAMKEKMILKLAV